MTNVELARAGTDAFNQRDLDGFLKLTDPDVEFVARVLQIEGGGPLRGHDGIRRWWNEMLGVFPDFVVEVEDVRDLGDVIIARQRHRARGGESNAPMEELGWLVTVWRDGRVVWWRDFDNEEEALAQARGRANGGD